MIGAEIYNEKGELYYSTLQASGTNITLHTKMLNHGMTIALTDDGDVIAPPLDTGIPVSSICLVFVAIRSGSRTFTMTEKGSNGNWWIQQYLSPDSAIRGDGARATDYLTTYFDFYIFSNIQKAVPDSGSYGLVFYNEHGVPVFNQDSKNLNILSTPNSEPTDGYKPMPHPVATLAVVTKGFQEWIGGVGIFFYLWHAIGDGNGISKIRELGIGGMGITNPVYSNPILYINTTEY